MPEGRCVVITGAESGIGAACAVAFGQIGDRVAVLYFKDDGAAAKSVEAVKTAGGDAIAVQCAVDQEESVNAAFAAVENAYGAASVLVNSAGINMSGIKVRDMPSAIWQRMLATDLTGAFYMSRRFLTGRGADMSPGAIVHISSIHAEAVRVGGADYCSAKGGLSNLVKTLALEEAMTGVRVNAIEPGMILTPMNEHAVEDAAYRQGLEKNIPMQRAGRPEEIAKMARWLASDEASYVTGGLFVADGGLSLLQGVGA